MTASSASLAARSCSRRRILTSFAASRGSWWRRNSVPSARRAPRCQGFGPSSSGHTPRLAGQLVTVLGPNQASHDLDLVTVDPSSHHPPAGDHDLSANLGQDWPDRLLLIRTRADPPLTALCTPH